MSRNSMEHNLWWAVIRQAADDVKSSLDDKRERVLRWLDSKDFITVCGYAGADPEYITVRIKKLNRERSRYMLADKRRNKNVKI